MKKDGPKLNGVQSIADMNEQGQIGKVLDVSDLCKTSWAKVRPHVVI